MSLLEVNSCDSSGIKSNYAAPAELDSNPNFGAVFTTLRLVPLVYYTADIEDAKLDPSDVWVELSRCGCQSKQMEVKSDLHQGEVDLSETTCCFVPLTVVRQMHEQNMCRRYSM